jgi:hypothetical protein
MIIMSLREAFAATKQSPHKKGDCFATCARNDMATARLAPLRQLQSQTQEELDALLPSVLRPQGGAFKGEL